MKKNYIRIKDKNIIESIKKITNCDYKIIDNFILCDKIEDILADLVVEYFSLLDTCKESLREGNDEYDAYIDMKLEKDFKSDGGNI